MKNKALLITTIIFFLLVNTTYYWEGLLGVWAMLMTLLLLATFIVLSVGLLYHLILTITEKFRIRQRIILITIMTIVLSLSFYKPFGLIDFEKFEGEDLLIAGREGAANCMTTIKLKTNNKFHDRSVCFGVDVISGEYSIKNDTIKFENVSYNKGKAYYKFAVINPTIFKNKSMLGDLILFRGLNDTLPLTLYITKNELIK